MIILCLDVWMMNILCLDVWMMNSLCLDVWLMNSLFPISMAERKLPIVHIVVISYRFCVSKRQ